MKYINDFIISRSERLNDRYQLLTLTSQEILPLQEARPGQFVQVKIDRSSSTFLRRPISIHDIDSEANTMTLLVARAGKGTDTLCSMPEGEVVNIMWPLGNTFSLPEEPDANVLLAGGGVGVAPLLYFSKILASRGIKPSILLAARSAGDLLRVDEFRKYGDVHLSTDDGSAGEKGLITANSAFSATRDHVYTCGPMPMMKAIAHSCGERGIDCEVSLENVMACGVGACLCCVEKTVKGNRCVCTEGPVFNIKELTW